MRKIFEALRIALQSMTSNKLRSFLTMLGIIIGVFSVVALISVISGLRGDIVNSVEALGANTIIATSGKVQSGGAASLGQSFAQAQDVFTDNDIKKIAETPDVIGVDAVNNGFGEYAVGDTKIQSAIGGRGVLAFETSVLKVTNGRGFTASDVQDKKKVVILVETLAKDLYGSTDVAGKSVTIDNDTFTVIGTVVIQSSSFFSGSGFASIGIMPYTTLREHLKQEKYSSLMIKATDKAAAETLGKSLIPIITKLHGEEDFSILTQKDIIGTIDTILNSIALALGMVTAISLVVGGIGIMNIMLVSVTERTREIGLRKAVGATTFDILFQFLIESILLSIVGGAIGLGLSYLAGRLVTSATGLPTLITLQSVIVALGASAGIGILFGLAPAIRAARKRPIEALRYE